MQAASTFILEMLTLYGIAILGFILKKVRLFHQDADHIFTQFVLYVTLPALIIFSLHTSFSVDLLKDFFWLTTMSVYILLISSTIAYWISRRRHLPKTQQPVFEGTIIFGNQGFIGFAISYLLLGEQGMMFVTMFNLFYLVHIWTYGIFLFRRSNASIDWKNILINPGIVATIIGMMFFFLPISLPNVITNGLEIVGKMTIPLSMMIIGMLIANVKWKDFKLFCKNKHIWLASFMRLLMIPCLLLPFFILPVSSSVLLIAVIISGMPAAPTISFYAQKFGADSTFGAFGTFITTILCLVTVPMLYGMLSMLTDYMNINWFTL